MNDYTKNFGDWQSMQSIFWVGILINLHNTTALITFLNKEILKKVSELFGTKFHTLNILTYLYVL